MTEKVAFTAKDGRKVEGALAVAKQPEKAPCVVLIHEWWGVTDHMKGIAERFSNQGFTALVPDLYHGKLATNPADAEKLMTSLNWTEALADISGAVGFLREHAHSNGKVGVLGFCMGGALSFAAACNIPHLGAVVPFYGIPRPDFANYNQVTAPILAHFAKHDGWAKADDAEAIRSNLTARGQTMELHVYDAQHAFFNDTRPEVYDAASAKQAWDRTLSFLRTHLE